MRTKEIGYRTRWDQEMLNGVCLLVNSCLKGKNERDFIAVWLRTKNEFITIIPSSKMKLCICWDQIGVVYYEPLNLTITSNRYQTQLMCLKQTLKKPPKYNEKHDRVLLQHDPMLDPMLQKCWRHTWKCWNGKSYSTRHTLQMLLLLTIACFD